MGWWQRFKSNGGDRRGVRSLASAWQAFLIGIAMLLLPACGLSPAASRATPTATPRPSPTRPAATPAPEAGALPQGRFAVGFVSEPSAGIVMEVPAFEIRDHRLRVYAAFAHRGERSRSFYAPLEPGRSAELRVGSRSLEPAAMSENFEEDICPEYPPSRRICLWIVGAVERGWFEFELPENASPPFVFRFPNFGRAELHPEKPLSGEVWDLPPGPFPQGEWTFEGSPAFRHLSVGVDLIFRRIQVDGRRMQVDLELRKPKGLLVFGSLPGPGELGAVDAAGHQRFPIQFPEDLKEMLPPGDTTRLSVTLVYSAPAVAGPIVFRLEGWPLVRFDPARKELVEVDWDGRAFVLAPTPTPSPARIARQEIEALIETMAEALRQRDPEVFLASFDPKAEADREGIRAVVSGGGWPLQDLRLEVTGGDFDPEEARDVSLELSVGLEGFPSEERWHYPAEADFRKIDGVWRVTRWSWGMTPPWARLPGRSWTSEHFTLIGPENLQGETAQAVLGELEEAYRDLSARLPREAIRPRYLALYAPDRQTFEALTGKNPRLTLGAAFYRTVPVIADEEVVGFQTSEVMLALNAEGVKSYRAADPIGGRAAVLRHELVHVILAPWTRPWTPGWLVEGAAMTYAGQPYWRELKEEIRGLESMTYTTEFGHIGDIFGTATARQYALASAMAEFVRERYGDAAFLALYRAYAEVPVETVEKHLPSIGLGTLLQASMQGIAQEVTPDLMRKHLGVDPAAFETAFLEWWKSKR